VADLPAFLRQLYARLGGIIAPVAHIAAFHGLHVALGLLRCLGIAAHLLVGRIAVELPQRRLELKALGRLRIGGVHVQHQADRRQHHHYQGAYAVPAQASTILFTTRGSSRP
jgi:hypothetical protein